MKKITNKDRFTAIIAALNGEETAVPTEDLLEFCQKQVDALERRSTKAKEKASERKEASDALTDAIYEVLGDDPMILNDICALIEGDDITPAKISNRCSKLTKAGLAVKSEISVPADKEAGTKARKLVAYARA